MRNEAQTRQEASACGSWYLLPSWWIQSHAPRYEVTLLLWPHLHCPSWERVREFHSRDLAVLQCRPDLPTRARPMSSGDSRCQKQASLRHWGSRFLSLHRRQACECVTGSGQLSKQHILLLSLPILINLSLAIFIIWLVPENVCVCSLFSKGRVGKQQPQQR